MTDRRSSLGDIVVAMPVRFLVRRGVQNTQKRAYILADNRLAEKAGWDEKILAVELQGLLADGFEVVLTGFEAPDIDVGVFLSSGGSCCL